MKEGSVNVPNYPSRTSHPSVRLVRFLIHCDSDLVNSVNIWMYFSATISAVMLDRVLLFPKNTHYFYVICPQLVMALPNVNSTSGRGVNSSALNATDDKEYLFMPISLASRATICSIMTVICIVGAIGNVSLIPFANREQRKRDQRGTALTNMYLFLRSLAISDLLAAIIGPLVWFELFGEAFQTNWGCRMRRYSSLVVHVITVYNLVAIAFERYNCICRSTGKLSRARLRQLIKAAWLLGFLVSLLPMPSYQGVHMDLNETHYTVTCGRDSSYTPYVLMLQICIVIAYIIPLIFLIVTSYRILQVMRAQASFRLALPSNNVPEKVLIEKRKQDKATRTLMIIIAAFVAPYLVFIGYHTVVTIFKPSLNFATNFMIVHVSVILGFLNVPVNFCIHLMQLPAFRAEWSKRLDYFKRPLSLRLGVFTTKKTYVVSRVRTESRPQNYLRRLSCPDVRKTTEDAPCRRRYSN